MRVSWALASFHYRPGNKDCKAEVQPMAVPLLSYCDIEQIIFHIFLMLEENTQHVRVVIKIISCYP